MSRKAIGFSSKSGPWQFQALVFIANELVALARSRLQPGQIDDCDHAADIADVSGLPENADGKVDAGSTNAHHFREELLREQKSVASRAITQQKKPTGAALFNGVEMMAGAGLHDLKNQPVQGKFHQTFYGGPVRQCALKYLHIDPHRLAFELNNCGPDGSSIIQNCRSAYKPFPPDRSHFQ
jgi:hypothetical protein